MELFRVLENSNDYATLEVNHKMIQEEELDYIPSTWRYIELYKDGEDFNMVFIDRGCSRLNKTTDSLTRNQIKVKRYIQNMIKRGLVF